MALIVYSPGLLCLIENFKQILWGNNISVYDQVIIVMISFGCVYRKSYKVGTPKIFTAAIPETGHKSLIQQCATKKLMNNKQRYTAQTQSDCSRKGCMIWVCAVCSAFLSQFFCLSFYNFYGK